MYVENNAPLELLKDFMEGSTRLLLKLHSQPKDYFTGVLRGFDEHCNLFLQDLKHYKITPIRNESNTIVSYKQECKALGESVIKGDTLLAVLEIVDSKFNN